MPGRFFLTASLSDVAAWAGVSRDGLDQPARRNIAPGEDIVTILEGGLGLMRWGLIPIGRTNARGRPVMETLINARSETVFDKSAYEGVGRCLIPANGWYEWTGETRKKQAWRIMRADRGLMAFAAIYDTWHGPGGIDVPQVASITCAPNADVYEIHHRMGVILRPNQFETWLHGTQSDAAKLMQPFPDGSLCVEPANDVDWSCG